MGTPNCLEISEVMRFFSSLSVTANSTSAMSHVLRLEDGRIGTIANHHNGLF